MNFVCRHCKSKLVDEVIDLGDQPPSNSYIKPEDIEKPEIQYPLKVFICNSCWLMQVPEYAKPEQLFTPDYAYLSSTSKSWCKHAKAFAKEAINKLELNSKDLVLELASNDGYLLKYFKDEKIPCVGIEPTKLAADISKKKGIKTFTDFFSLEYAKKFKQKDSSFNEGVNLIVANNVTAHVPDINDFMAGIKHLLKSKGYASIEFPHLLSLIKYNQFDTIYHEHYSYFSLYSFSKIVENVGLVVNDLDFLDTHGGSLRLWITHSSNSKKNNKVKDLLSLEKRCGLNSFKPYDDLYKKANRVKNELINFLNLEKKNNSKIVGYGAAAKGNTLLNFAGINKDLLPYIVDKSKSKQGKYMPGSKIPIYAPEELYKLKPDKVLVLPWNIINEIKNQLYDFKLVTAVPNLKIWS